jgi:glucokinase
MENENEMSDFDPYAFLVETSQIVTDLTFQHNALVNDYQKVKTRIAMLEKQLIDIQMQLIKRDFE